MPTAPDRVRRLRKHLAEALRALRTIKDFSRSDSPSPPEPEGFAARVASTACSLCRGWCCKDGGEHAYLDERTMARVRQAAKPGLNTRAVLRLYIERIPAVSYEGSCVFHGKIGCTLDRSLRSDICNNYYCGGLGTYVISGEATTPVIVFAGEGDQMRTSPVLKP